MEKKPIVLVSGCFDLLHSGHLKFFEEAAQFGDVYVALGSDENIENLKNRPTINKENERKWMINKLSDVKECFISYGNGDLHFLKDFLKIKPDYFIVNEDGHTASKQAICEKYGVKYVILQRTPPTGIPGRSTASLRHISTIPYRIDLAGGWLDQPETSKHYPGPVITLCLEPTIEFDEKSGMASSTRRTAIKMWKNRIPDGNKEELAKVLFCVDNHPGEKDYFSGSQDAIGIVMPGINLSHYDKKYWPIRIEPIHDNHILDWIENHLYFIKLEKRQKDYNPLTNTYANKANAMLLSVAAQNCWKAIKEMDLEKFGYFFTQSRKAQVRIFPSMTNDNIEKIAKEYKKDILGWKISGAGGGGYLVAISDKDIKGATKILIRRKSYYACTI